MSTYETIRATRMALAVMTVALLTTACNQGGSGAASQSPDETPAIPGVDELRATLTGENITALPAAPTIDDDLFALGEALFFDKVLSGNQDVSCATCHWPELASADARTLPRGVGGVGLGTDRFAGEVIPRNSPPAINAHLLERLFWDGRVERVNGTLQTPAGNALTAADRAIFDPRWQLLAAQAMFPVTSREEMRGQVGSNAIADLGDTDFQGIWTALRDRLLAYPQYQSLFLTAYPDLATIADVRFAHAANALAAYEVRAFARTDSPFERFVGGDDTAMTTEQVAGALEFFGRADCARCHSGRTFTDEDFHGIGLPQLGPGKGDGLGGSDDFGRERVTGDADDRYRFRTPTLLNVELTAPYGHAGQYANLTDMVRHYTDTRQFLDAYSIFANVTDTDLLGTLQSNQNAIRQAISGRVQQPNNFDVEAVASFLTALTDDSARDLSALVPLQVPSGLPVR